MNERNNVWLVDGSGNERVGAYGISRACNCTPAMKLLSQTFRLMAVRKHVHPCGLLGDRCVVIAWDRIASSMGLYFYPEKDSKMNSVLRKINSTPLK